MSPQQNGSPTEEGHLSSKTGIFISIFVWLVFVGNAIWLFSRGQSAQTEFEFFDQKFKSTDSGLAVLFIGTVVFVILIRPAIKAPRGSARPEDKETSPPEILPPPIELPPLGLPPGSRMPHAPNPQFVGREEELRELTKQLAPESPATVSVHAAVTGMGGVGKSQLAIEYVHRYGPLYRGGVFWLDMENAENAQNEVARCGGAEGMDFPSFNELSLPDQASRVQAAWKDGRQGLLVFDNVQEPDVVEQWRPKTGCCSLLITSRRSEWPPELGVTPLPLEKLPREKSLEYLAQERPVIDSEPGERDCADKICERLGDLPLALRVAGAYLRRYKTETLAEYLQVLEKQPALQDESLKEVSSCFALSYNKLDGNCETDALAIKLFHLSSHFAPVSISRELLPASAGLNYEERDDRHKADDALTRLHDLGVIGEEPNRRILLHRLLREFARLHPPLDTGEKEPVEAVVEAVFDFAQNENKTKLPQRLAAEVPHLREVAVVADQRNSPLASVLFNELGIYLQMTAAYTEAKAHFQRALEIHEKAYGPDRPEVATFANNLGQILKEQGDLEGALKYTKRALEIDQKVYGPDHPQVAIYTNNLGSILLAQGDLDGAWKYTKRALEIDQKVYGPDHPNVATAANNLGQILKARGDLDGALKYTKRALDINEKAYGLDHPHIAGGANNLGQILKEQGDLEGALKYTKRALDLYEKAYGPDHPHIAGGTNNLGQILKAQGDLEGALNYTQRALEICEKVYGTDHPRTRIVAKNIALIKRAME